VRDVPDEPDELGHSRGRHDEPLGEPSARRKRAYFWLMGTCVVLIVLAWNVVRLWSVPVAVAMSIVAAVIPPVAVVVANWGRER
jgi:hypothetical protein